MSEMYNTGGQGSGSGGTSGSGHDTASATKSYHNGGVEGESFSNWYDAHLANQVSGIQEENDSSGSGGTKGSGSGGTKGSGSGGTKGSGSGGTKGSGSGGTKGSGSGGTKGSGSGGTIGGHSQWGGENASAAANSLPAYTAYPEDLAGEQDPSVNDVMSLMTQDVEDENQDVSYGSATAGGIEMDMF